MRCGNSVFLPLLVSVTLAACAGPGARRVQSSAGSAPVRASNPVSPLPARAQAQSQAPSPAPVAAPKPVAAPAPVPVAPKPAVEPPKNSRDRFSAAVELVGKNQFKDAEPLLEALAKENPNNSGPLTNLGIVYYKTSRREPALAAFSRAAVANPRNAVAYNWLGILYRENGDYGRAEQAYQRALQANDGYAAAHLNLGILYDQYLKRPAQALEQYRRYARLERSDELRVAAWIAALEPPKKTESKPESKP